jgi:hypothetical protein
MLIHLGALPLPALLLKILPILSLGPILYFGVPVLIGFLWIWRDANQRGQPGWLWALVTIPLHWLALLAYIVVRALMQQRAGALAGPPSPPTTGTDQVTAS